MKAKELKEALVAACGSTIIIGTPETRKSGITEEWARNTLDFHGLQLPEIVTHPAITKTMTTWEIGQAIEKIMDEGAKAADDELLSDWKGLPLPSSIEVQKEIWARLINWKGVQIR